ncbi:MAG: NADH oxidoreductase (quinone) subunit F [Ignavibacteria bacterium GWB2_35_12]|nr:MAG: NADH oxidoreductase (quinone) subunit F [Ignavibacteria bacterium GWA2_35_8]OGU40099.1 MAG: NADH oxidoreductase (quinone) subunit F [Ignavibacteria bacterium GWB2_35_12]OGU87408.1 MAG: NADH oxidoreductase (quinone) subunit F [Ignavibacteria bacterium RIFOXYA2_FULL_35_10]OGV22029.1 MAG: NADH oxidoreductase (quinone) subunit F [Ignavibacteria bacterium RIFOXYC2_FULL_35_21]
MNDTPRLILHDIPDYHKLDVYIANGGYETYRKAIKMAPDEVTNEVRKSGLRGRGGAAFPTGLKWTFMPKGSDRPKYLAVNGDESEPGSFKDRQIFEHNPHQLIEGILISGYAMGINTAYIYIRGEYHKWINLMQKAIDDAYSRGFVGPKMNDTFGNNYYLDIYIHKGAGAYICGEETSLMTSIEGDRGYPRYKPPFPAQRGLWDMPTTVNNVETITTVTPILNMGGDNFAKIGAPGHPGTLLFGVSGHVNKPGVYELPTGTLLTDIIYNYCGGVKNNKKIKAVIPGGSSMPPLRGDEIEGVKMDEESLKVLGTHIGTGGIIVMDEDTDLVKATLRIAHFYHHESCGQCTPCREGCGWMENVLHRIETGDATSKDLDLLVSIANNIEGNTICALGDAAAWPVRGFVTKFRDEFEKAVKEKRTFISPNIVHGKRSSANTLLQAS